MQNSELVMCLSHLTDVSLSGEAVPGLLEGVPHAYADLGVTKVVPLGAADDEQVND